MKIKVTTNTKFASGTMSLIRGFLLSGCLVLVSPASWAVYDTPSGLFHANEGTDNPDALLVWLSPGFLSYHFKNNETLRGKNYGLGTQVDITPSLSLMTGFYLNSFNDRSNYAGFYWRPVDVGFAKIGLVATAIDGYQRMRHGQWFVAAMPAMSIEYRNVGVNLILIPPVGMKIHGSLAAQIKIRVW